MNMKNKGITLIALVITIIILIILAAISINAAFGENGLIAKAREAAFKTEVSAIKDLIEVKRVEIELSEYFNESTQDLPTYLNSLTNSEHIKYIGDKKLVISGGKLCYYNENDSEFSQTQKNWLEQIGIGPARKD